MLITFSLTFFYFPYKRYPYIYTILYYMAANEKMMQWKKKMKSWEERKKRWGRSKVTGVKKEVKSKKE